MNLNLQSGFENKTANDDHNFLRELGSIPERLFVQTHLTWRQLRVKTNLQKQTFQLTSDKKNKNIRLISDKNLFLPHVLYDKPVNSFLLLF